ncbi:MAG: CpsD/CapB family tyrosine-protein kinase [Blastocatellia bacterium]
MAQLVTETIPELAKFDENDLLAPINGKQKTTKGLANSVGGVGEEISLEPPVRQMQTQRSMLRPSRDVELTLTRLDPHLVAIHELEPQAVSQFNRLAISLISGSARYPMKRVMMTSAHHGEGRTCVTLNLAAALARAKQRVLVIDADLRRPSVCRLLGIETEVGLAETVALGLQPEAAITRILPADFHVLPTRGQVENSAELLSSQNFKRMLSELDSCYDFILFDSTPLLTAADASLLGLVTTATLLVVRPGSTSSAEMSRSIALLNEEAFFGVVMNRVNA